MTLGEYILKWRTEHEQSQRQFAMRCGLSNGYIAMLERNENPATGKPIVPKLAQIRAIANAMGMSADELIRATDGDTPVSLSSEPSSKQQELIDLAYTVPEDQIDFVVRLIQAGLATIRK